MFGRGQSPPLQIPLDSSIQIIGEWDIQVMEFCMGYQGTKFLPGVEWVIPWWKSQSRRMVLFSNRKILTTFPTAPLMREVPQPTKIKYFNFLALAKNLN